jgi:acyl-CoA thioesterase-1
VLNGVASAGGERTLLVFGDSLSAAYGMRADQGWVAQLQIRLRTQGYGYRVVNASVSGETTSGGKSRLDRALQQHAPALVVLELGANDGLRGLPVKDATLNLRAMVATIQHARAKTLLLGIMLPPNYGPRYRDNFAAMYRSIAATSQIPLVPFLLQGIALDPRLMQPDGLHPNAAGQRLVLDNVWRQLRPMLER